MSLRRYLFRWPLFASLLLTRLILLASASAQQLPYEVPDFTGKTYDMVLQMAIDPHTHRQVFGHITLPLSRDATVVRQDPARRAIIPYGSKVDLQLVWLPEQNQPAKPSILSLVKEQAAKLVNPQPPAQIQPITHLPPEALKPPVLPHTPAAYIPPTTSYIPPAPSLVPKLIGVDKTEASRRLEIAKLRANFDGGPGGVVINVNPPEQTQVRPSDRINVTMGTFVPHLATYSVAQAQQILQAAGLQLGAVSPSDGTGGAVSNSDPAEGVGVPLKSVVNLSLFPVKKRPQGMAGNGLSQGVQPPPIAQQSTGAQPPTGIQDIPQVPVPDVLKKAQKPAYISLESKGFHSVVSHGDVNGVVVRQTPQENSLADPALQVDLYLELPQVTVPDVRGQTSTTTTSAIATAGLEPKVDNGPGQVPETQTRVLFQDPLPGAMVDPHSTVRVVMEPRKGSEGRSTRMIILLIAFAAGGIAIVVKVIRILIPPQPPIPSPTPFSHTNHLPTPAHCTFKPQIGLPKFTIPTTTPAIRFSLTLQRQEGAPEYRIANQPSVKPVRQQP